MNRQELLRTAESLRDTDYVTSAVLKDDWGSDDNPCIHVRARGLPTAVQNLIRDGAIASQFATGEDDDGKLKTKLRL